jgi:hypothetical protein
MLLTVDFSGEEVDALFSQRAGLGESGEVFLTDAAESRSRRCGSHRRDRRTGRLAGTVAALRGGPDEDITYDYRGVMTVHAFRPATVLDGGCIDAHVNHAEALEPSESLRAELIGRGSAFVLMGALCR